MNFTYKPFGEERFGEIHSARSNNNLFDKSSMICSSKLFHYRNYPQAPSGSESLHTYQATTIYKSDTQVHICIYIMYITYVCISRAG